MTIMAILMGAMTSAILMASHALPTGQTPLEKKTQAADIVGQIAGELFYATAITEATANAVTFTVADRGHGAAGPETIRYAWAGTAGDPLTRHYNGGTVVTLCEDVELFKLVYTARTTRLQGAPRVLLIVDDDVSPGAQDEARRTMIESWGLPVQVLAGSRSAAEYATALDTSDVIYVSEENTTALPDLVVGAARGIVVEQRNEFPRLGISEASNWLWTGSIDLLDNKHDITEPFALGTLQLFSTAGYAVYSWKQIAAGGQILARDGFFSYEMFITIEVDGVLFGGGRAPARRVSLPWGDQTFDFNTLTDDALMIMQRSIVWAAQPVVYSGVSIVLRPTAGSERVRTETQILNMPRATGP